MEVVGLGKACEIAKRGLEKTGEHLQQLRDRLFEGLKNNIENLRINGHPKLRLPNTLNVSFHGVTADALLAAVQDRVAVSAGAACHSGTVEMSSVLKAMRVPEEWARGTIRFSVGRMTTADQIDEVIRVFSAAVRKLTAQH
jgi:cysteine desulfurase